jgi:hypothetical protein
MVARLRNDSKVRQLFEQILRKARSLAIGNERIEASQRIR